jgi:hypothetical protein
VRRPRPGEIAAMKADASAADLIDSHIDVETRCLVSAAATGLGSRALEARYCNLAMREPLIAALSAASQGHR